MKLADLSINTGNHEFTRYFCAGSLTFAADFAVLFALTEGAGLPYLVSNLFSVMVGIVVSYLFCIKWVFACRRYAERRSLEFGLFVLTCLAGLALNELLLWLFVEGLALHYLVAKVWVAGVVFIFNFLLKKRTLFATGT